MNIRQFSLHFRVCAFLNICPAYFDGSIILPDYIIILVITNVCSRFTRKAISLQLYDYLICGSVLHILIPVARGKRILTVDLLVLSREPQKIIRDAVQENVRTPESEIFSVNDGLLWKLRCLSSTNCCSSVGYYLTKISWNVKGAQLCWAFSLPLIRQLIFRYSGIRSGYIIAISPLTFPQFRIGIVHFFVASKVAR